MPRSRMRGLARRLRRAVTPQAEVEVFTPAWRELNTPPMEEMSMINPTETRANLEGWRRKGNLSVGVSYVILQVFQKLVPDFTEKEYEITEGQWYAGAMAALMYTLYVFRYFLLSIWHREPNEKIMQNGFAFLTCIVALYFGYIDFSDSQSLTLYSMVILCQLTLATFVS